MPAPHVIQPTYLTSQVLQQAAIYLNDASMTRYTPPLLLPFMQDAFRKLETALLEMGSDVMKSSVDNDFWPPDTTGAVSQVILVSPSTIPIDILGGNPTYKAMVYPIRIFERLQNSDEDWVPMKPVAWEFINSRTPDVALRYWAFRGFHIYGPGCTTLRELRIEYTKLHFDMTDGGDYDAVIRPESYLYLILRTAALAANYQGENPTRAAQLDTDAREELEKILQMATHQLQLYPRRRRGYKINRRRFAVGG